MYHRKECIFHIQKFCTIKNWIKIGIKQIISSNEGTFFGVIGAVHNRSIQIYTFTLAYPIIISSLAQWVESLPLNTDFASSKPLGLNYFFFMQIVFLNLFYLLFYTSRKILNFSTFSPFSPVVEIADNGCIWWHIDGSDATLLS